MKKTIFLSAALMLFVSYACKAQDPKQIFTSKQVVWFGLDFTKAKFVGSFDQGNGINPASGSDMKNKYVPAWNALILKEPQHFKIKESFRKDDVYYDVESVNKLNTEIDPDDCMVVNDQQLEKSAIDGLVKRYTSSKTEGLGLVFIVDSFNKNALTASIYVTFFDIATKQVLLSEKLKGTPVGIGMRNYWAGAIKQILKDVDLTEYKKWKDGIMKK